MGSQDYDRLVLPATKFSIERLLFGSDMKCKKKAGALYAATAWPRKSEPTEIILTIMRMARRNFAHLNNAPILANHVVGSLSGVRGCSALDDASAMVALLMGEDADGGASGGGGKKKKKTKAKKKGKKKGGPSPLLTAEQELLACILVERAALVHREKATKKSGGAAATERKIQFADATINSLGDLFERFKSNTTVLSQLAKLPRLVDASWFLRKENKKVLTSTLNEFRTMFCRYGDQRLLEEMSKTLNALYKEESLKQHTRGCFAKLFKDTAKQTKAVLKEESVDVEDETKLAHAMMRADLLNKCRILCDSKTGAVNVDSVSALLDERHDAVRLLRESAYMQPRVVDGALGSLRSHLMGDLSSLISHVVETAGGGGSGAMELDAAAKADEEDEVEDEERDAMVASIQKQRDTLSLHLERVLRGANSGVESSASSEAEAYCSEVAKATYGHVASFQNMLPPRFEAFQGLQDISWKPDATMYKLCAKHLRRVLPTRVGESLSERSFQAESIATTIEATCLLLAASSSSLRDDEGMSEHQKLIAVHLLRFQMVQECRPDDAPVVDGICHERVKAAIEALRSNNRDNDLLDTIFLLLKEEWAQIVADGLSKADLTFLVHVATKLSVYKGFMHAFKLKPLLVDCFGDFLTKSIQWVFEDEDATAERSGFLEIIAEFAGKYASAKKKTKTNASSSSKVLDLFHECEAKWSEAHGDDDDDDDDDDVAATRASFQVFAARLAGGKKVKKAKAKSRKPAASARARSAARRRSRELVMSEEDDEEEEEEKEEEEEEEDSMEMDSSEARAPSRSDRRRSRASSASRGSHANLGFSSDEEEEDEEEEDDFEAPVVSASRKRKAKAVAVRKKRKSKTPVVAKAGQWMKTGKSQQEPEAVEHSDDGNESEASQSSQMPVVARKKKRRRF